MTRINLHYYPNEIALHIFCIGGGQARLVLPCVNGRVGQSQFQSLFEPYTPLGEGYSQSGACPSFVISGPDRAYVLQIPEVEIRQHLFDIAQLWRSNGLFLGLTNSGESFFSLHRGKEGFVFQSHNRTGVRSYSVDHFDGGATREFVLDGRSAYYKVERQILPFVLAFMTAAPSKPPFFNLGNRCGLPPAREKSK